MKKYVTRENLSDCRICGSFNYSPLNISYIVTDKVLKAEKLHFHTDDYEYYIFLKGSGEIEVNSKIYPYKKGDVYMIEPKEPHRILSIFDKTEYVVVRTNFSPKGKITLQ